MPTAEPSPLVSDREFIVATRDTGYRSTAAAISELIDNSIQAKARTVTVRVHEGRTARGRSLAVSVLDNGTGMDGPTLRRALQFGGSSRFGDRTGPGRFGMGLPNSSVSQARRVDVFAWQGGRTPLHTYLDVDEISSGRNLGVPEPRMKQLPPWAVREAGSSGTLVTWTRCDRLENRKATTVTDKLRPALGRTFRYFLLDGVKILLNGSPLEPVDPLFAGGTAPSDAAAELLAPLYFDVLIPGGDGRVSIVGVRFSVLPVEAWSRLPAAEKRRRGISGGAGVSIVRARREVAYGWFLMGGKRKENYDDWWRCEVAFEPALDELFGISHSKQGIAPSQEIAAIVSSTMEGTARLLNRQARERFMGLRPLASSRSASLATAHESFLPPLASSTGPGPAIKQGLAMTRAATRHVVDYEIRVLPLRTGDFYSYDWKDSALVVTVNSSHPFYEALYAPLTKPGLEKERVALECLLLSSARADVDLPSAVHRAAVAARLRGWSNALATFLGS